MGMSAPAERHGSPGWPGWLTQVSLDPALTQHYGYFKNSVYKFKKTNVLWTAWLHVLQIVEINKNIRMVYVCSWLWSWMHFQVSKLVIDKNTGNYLVVFAGSALHYETKYFSPRQSTHGHCVIKQWSPLQQQTINPEPSASGKSPKILKSVIFFAIIMFASHYQISFVRDILLKTAFFL